MPTIDEYNLTSSEVKLVYPTTRRGVTASRNVSEESWTRIINQIVDVDSFIITKTLPNADDDSTDTIFEFNIHGYYFKVDLNALETSEVGNNIYANILITTDNDFKELYGQDDDGMYTALILSNAPLGAQGSTITQNEATFTVYYLELLKRDNENSPWVIPQSSLYKFGETSLSFSIDGGDITSNYSGS